MIEQGLGLYGEGDLDGALLIWERVLVIDLLGHGRSDPPRRESMTIAAHATRVIQLMDVMGVPVASVAGHDMGAAIAVCVAQQRPDRVAHLALVNPTMLGATPNDVVLSGRITRLAVLAPLGHAQPLPPGPFRTGGRGIA